MSETVFATIPVLTPISEERAHDLMCNAFEGGSNYWIEKARRAGIRLPEYTHQVPFAQDCWIDLWFDHPTQEGQGHFRLNRAACIKGLEVMAAKYPRHFANFLSEDDDAETGDVYLQCCVFGEIVFG